MADKVDSLLEKMVDEFAYYQKETLFSKKEITKIVKQRKKDEYLMQRKDADISMFLEAIQYEQKLERIRKARVVKQKKSAKEAGIARKATQFREENCVRRRIMHLYSRACRKYRQNKFIKLEYLQYLVQTGAVQMLNKVLAECLQVMP